MLKEMSISQKKILILAVTGVTAMIIFYIFVYSPAKAAIGKLKAELAQINSQLFEIEGVLKQSRNMDEGIQLLEKQYERFNAYFPSLEENAFRAISDFAKNMKIEIESMEPQPKAVFLGQDNKAVVIDGKTCYSMLISTRLRCSYAELVNYLEALMDAATAYLTIERLEIGKNPADSQKLNIRLDFNVYLLA